MSSEFQLRTQNKSLANYFLKEGKTRSFLDFDFHDLEISKEKYAAEWKSAQASTTTIPGNQVFRLFSQEGYVGSQILELVCPSLGAGLTRLPYWPYNLIDTVTIYVAGKQTHQYTGHGLLQYIISVNQKIATKTALLALASGDNTAATSSGTVFVPLLAPGNNCMMGYHQTPFNIGACAQEMQIIIKFNAATAIEVTTSTSVVTALTSSRILYKRYKGEGTSGIIANFGNSRDVINTYKTVDLACSTELTGTMSTSAYTTISTANLNRNADSLALLCDFVVSTAAKTDPFLGIQTANLNYQCLSNDIYWHDSANLGNFKHLKAFGETQDYVATTKYQYVLPFTADYLGAVKGISNGSINLYGMVPILRAYGPTAAAYQVSTVNVLNMLIDLQKDGNINIVYQDDGTHPLPKKEAIVVKDGN